jgi:hypothetical protein
MRRRHSIAIAGAAFLAWSAPVQGQCAAGYTQDACQKAVDLFHFLTPQISTALAGGAATIGQGGVLGGFPHWTLGVRATAVRGAFPKLDNVGFRTDGQVKTDFAVEKQFVPMATIDGSLGIFKGVPLGVTRVGGIDAILTATYVPSAPEGGDVTVALPGGSTKFGGGVRVGLLQESILVPGVSFTYVQRALPTINVTAVSTVTASGTTQPGAAVIDGLSLKTKGWRLSASKSFLAFGLQAGVGQDKYDNSASYAVSVGAVQPASAPAPQPVRNSLTRTNIYAGLSFNFFIGRLVAEVGQASGGSMDRMYNTFGGSNDATKSRSYFSVGLRTGF